MPRKLSASPLAASALVLALAAPAGAATVRLGQVAPDSAVGGQHTCNNCGSVQLTTGGPISSVVPPGHWILPSRSFNSGVGDAGSHTLLFLAKTGSMEYTVRVSLPK